MHNKIFELLSEIEDMIEGAPIVTEEDKSILTDIDEAEDVGYCDGYSEALMDVQALVMRVFDVSESPDRMV